MKKLIYFFVVMVVIVLFALLYTHTSTFSVNNIEKLYVKDNPNEVFDLSDEMVIKFIKKLDGLKQYKRTNSEQGIVSRILVVEKKFGQDNLYKIDLDHDFEHLKITDLRSELTYLVDDQMVEWLYMHQAFSSIYNYKNIQNHQILLEGNPFRTKMSLEWQYMKADRMWYDDYQSDPVLNRIQIENNPLDIEVSYTQMPDSSILNVFDQDSLIYSGDINQGIYHPNKNGLYLYQIKTKWHSDLYQGFEISEFEVECILSPTFDVSSTELEQGQTIVIRGRNITEPETLFIEQSYLEGIHFSKVNQYYECVIPATYYTTPGQYRLQYGVGEMIYELNFEVKERNYEIQYLYVDEKTVASTQNAAAYEEYNKYYKNALLMDFYSGDESFFETPSFMLPTTGRLTTEFGEQRYVNDKATSYHHAGLDIANDIGTKVYAAFDGQVVMARHLMVTGNSVVISHGNGIFSTYFHMDSLEVLDQQIVKKGDLLGYMGTTGFSTGSHLHFGISYYKMNLEPGYFIYGKKATYDQYNNLINTQ